MKNKYVGILIIAISVIILLLTISYNNALEDIVNESCVHGDSCPMQTTLMMQKAVSYGLFAILILVGILITFFLKDKVPGVSKEDVTTAINAAVKSNANSSESKLTDAKKQSILESLEGQEKAAMQIIFGGEGSIYQSDLVKELKLTKVKTTRLLDKLEGKGLIERKRRGMTNIVVLK